MNKLALAACTLLLTACGSADAPNADASPTSAPAELTVYSARNEQLIGPLFQEYTAQTGTPIQLVTGDAGPLLERLKAEGTQSPADILLTVDAGNLWQAAESGLLQPLNSATLEQSVPAHLRDPENRWFGLSVRARTIVHHPQRAPAASLSGYAALADPLWRERLCLRTSAKVYNQSLVAMLIAEHGPDQAEQIIRGWVANLAAPPFPNDTAVIQAIAAGQCDVGIVNTYYFGRLLREQPDLQARLFWPDQDGSGVHVNVSGAGVVRGSQNADAAQALIEWLASAQAQARFAGNNLEYPVNPQVDPVAEVEAWGSFQANPLNVAEAGRLQAAAVKLMDRAGYR